MEEKNTTRKKKNAGLPWEAWKKRAALLTAVLGGGYFLSRKWLKNGIPPIAFIVICAAAGLAVWGI